MQISNNIKIKLGFLLMFFKFNFSNLLTPFIEDIQLQKVKYKTTIFKGELLEKDDYTVLVSFHGIKVRLIGYQMKTNNGLIYFSSTFSMILSLTGSYKTG